MSLSINLIFPCPYRRAGTEETGGLRGPRKIRTFLRLRRQGAQPDLLLVIFVFLGLGARAWYMVATLH